MINQIHNLFVALVLCAPAADASAAPAYSVLHHFGATNDTTGFGSYAPLAQSADGTLYGVTTYGGNGNSGTIFRVNTNGSTYILLHSFSPPSGTPATNADGFAPQGGLLLSGNTLYGATMSGGSKGNGVIFKVNTDASGFAVLHTFGPNQGAQTSSRLTLAPDGTLYGAPASGGTNGLGTVFKVSTNGTGFALLHTFSNSEGWFPNGVVLLGDTLYGTTYRGGAYESGTVFTLNTNGSNFATIHSFLEDTNGQIPNCELVATNGVLYGTTTGGSFGDANYQTIFELNTNGTGFAILHTFNYSDGYQPESELILSGNALYGTTTYGGYGEAGTVFKIGTDGSNFTVLHNFDVVEGEDVYAGLLLSGGVLYGTAFSGGAGDSGSIFKLNVDGTGFTNIYSFIGFDGSNPTGGLLYSGGALYGTAQNGGNYAGGGTIYKIDATGSNYTILTHFGGLDISGKNPHAGVALLGSTLFGTAYAGGGNGYGEVFEIQTNGDYGTGGYEFDVTDGSYPSGGVVVVSNNVYGTTAFGGTGSSGTIFEMNIYGELTTLYNFTNTNGEYPFGTLVASGNMLYGTTAYGGTSSGGGDGTIFTIKNDGTGFVTLHDFLNTEGFDIQAGLVLSGGVLYGTAFDGGSGGKGSVFKINTNGTGFAVLHNFIGTDGANPLGLLALNGGYIYGVTQNGGTHSDGTVYTLNMDGSGFTNLYNFAGIDGANPESGLVLVGGTLYGTAENGGNLGRGVLFALKAFTAPIPLNIQLIANSAVLTWSDPGFSLQAAPLLGGTFTNVPGSTSPYTNAISGSQRYFRLVSN
jgi:uncharacterized repeat protein (TIGR03803 family)